MLPDVQYKLATTALHRAATDIAELQAYVDLRPEGAVGRKNDAECAQRRRMYHRHLEAMCGDLQASANTLDISFQDMLNTVIAGRDRDQVRADRAYFAKFHSDVLLRHNFFKAMDALAEDKDNGIGAAPVALVKMHLRKKETFDHRTIAAIVIDLDLRKYNISNRELACTLITLLQDTKNPEARAAFEAAKGQKPASAYVMTYEKAMQLRAA